MVTLKVRKLLEAAVASPESYIKGSNLGKLRASFDSMSAQVCHALIGVAPLNRTMVRKELNNAAEQDMSERERKLVNALNAALHACENTIHRKDYIDHSKSIKAFILNELQSVVRELP